MVNYSCCVRYNRIRFFWVACAAVCAFAQQSGTASPPPAAYAGTPWPTIIGLALGLIAALLGLCKAYYEYKKARHELDKERSRPTIDRVDELFQHCRCTNGRICREILTLSFSTTFEQAVGALQQLLTALRDPGAASVEPVLQWTQEELARVVDPARLPKMEGPEHRSDAETKTAQCYALLVPFLNDPDRVRIAINHCRTWIHDSPTPHLQREVVCNLLPILLNHQPNSDTLHGVYEEVIKRGNDAVEMREQDIVKSALSGLQVMPQLSSPHLLRLLQAGYTAATHHWEAFGQEWAHAVHSTLLGDRLQHPEWRSLASQVSAHLRTQGLSILVLPRKHEYLSYCSVIVTTHNGLGNHRKLRPKNRHVIQQEHPVQVALTLESHSASPSIGNLGNFSLAEPGWQSGAWITTEALPGWTASSGWRAGTLVLSDDTGPLGTFHAEISGPTTIEDPTTNPYGHAYGYRARFASLSPENILALEALTRRHPVTR